MSRTLKLLGVRKEDPATAGIREFVCVLSETEQGDSSLRLPVPMVNEDYFCNPEKMARLLQVSPCGDLIMPRGFQV